MIDEARFNGLNNSMDGIEFIGNDQSRLIFWNLLVAGIYQIAGGPDLVTIPDPNEIHAWRKTWAIYVRLRDRANAPPSPEAASQAIASQQLERDWNNYLNNREELILQINHHGMNHDAQEYCGIEPGDLGEPTSNDDESQRWFRGRRKDWRVVAERLSDAIGKWRNTPVRDRPRIPGHMAAFRTARALDEMKSLNEALVAHVNGLEARIVELESTAIRRGGNGQIVKSSAA